MTLPTWYDTGTVSVANGSTLLLATGALWGGDAIMAGDLFCDPAQPLVPPQRIVGVAYDDDLDTWTAELWAPWPGTSLTDDAYEIRYVGIIERSTAQTRKVLEQLGEVSAYFDRHVNDTAERLALESIDRPLRANYRVLVSNIGDGTAAIYSKASAAYDDWTEPAPYSGPIGPIGPTGPIGINWTGPWNSGTTYALNDGALNNGSSWRSLQDDNTNHAPPTLPTTSNAWWALIAAKGTDGTGTGDVVGPALSVDNRLAAFDGTTGKLLKDSGVPLSSLARVIRMQKFTASGTYTPHASMVCCLIECVGGGAGGAGAKAAAGRGTGGGGGGAGGYSRKLCTAADIGASKAVTIGAGGTGGSSTPNPGAVGGDTSVGSLCIALGGGQPGAGSGGVPGAGGPGGALGTGDFTAEGTPGFVGSGSDTATFYPTNGAGGPGHFGGAGRSTRSSGTGAIPGLNAPANSGGGGSGAIEFNQAVGAAGGNGGSGVVIITEFCSA